MTTHQIIAGTDVAMIGIWDHKWSNPSTRDKSLSKSLKRLSADAERRQQLINLLDQTYDYFSVAAITPRQSLCVHGGIPHGGQTVRENP